MRFWRWIAVLLILLCFSAGLRSVAAAQDASTPPFAVRVIDDTADGRSDKGPTGDTRFPLSTRGIGQPGFLWLKDQGGMEGPLIVEAHVGPGADGQPVVLFTFTPEGGESFVAMTKATLGRRLAFVVNGTIVTTALINGVASGREFQISGYYTDAEAHELADELVATSRTVK